MRRCILCLMAMLLLTACTSHDYVPYTAEQGDHKTGTDTFENLEISLEEGEGVSFGKSGIADIVIDAETGSLKEDADDIITFLFAGDIYLSDYVTQAYQKSGIAGVLDAGYRQQIADADVFFANEEFPFSDRGEAIDDKEYTYRVPTSWISVFRELGLDGVTLANNHVLDYGADALLDTYNVLDSAGIIHTGAGEDLTAAKVPAVFSAGDKTVAIVGASRVTPDATWFASRYNAGVFSAYQPENLLEQIRTLAEDDIYDAVIAYIHWGIERDEFPQDYQRTLARQLIDAGADIVIGAHPHVMQGIEYYKGKPIFYSMGNFIFGSSIPRTALLKVTWKGDDDPTFKLLPGSAAFGYTQMMNSDEKRQEFFRYMESISEGVVISDDGTVNPAVD